MFAGSTCESCSYPYPFRPQLRKDGPTWRRLACIMYRQSTDDQARFILVFGRCFSPNNVQNMN